MNLISVLKLHRFGFGCNQFSVNATSNLIQTIVQTRRILVGAYSTNTTANTTTNSNNMCTQRQKEFLPIQKEKDLNALWEYIGRNFLPKSCLIHNCLRLHLDKRLSDKFKSSFYTYGDPVNETRDDNFVLCVQHNHYLKDRTVLLLPPKIVTKEMTNAIESLINWNIPHTFAELEDPLCTTLHEMCKRHKNPVQRNKYITNAYKEPENDVGIPKEIGIRSLTVDDAPIINDTWSYKMEGTLEMLQDLITNLDSVGLYIKSTGELVSWHLTSPLGFTTAMYTLREHRGKGYASITLQEFGQIFKTKNMLANGQSAFKNTSSVAAIQRSGWEHVGVNEWLEYDFPYLNH